MNEEPYITLAGRGESEHVVERSRFLGVAIPIDDLDDAMAFVDEIKSEHYDARHVVFGLRIGRGAQGIDRSNDDGEPARTGGFPLWQLLEGEDVIDAMIVVTRYYGGVKLGTGGLARAYREAGRQALDDAGLKTVYPEVELEFSAPYNRVDKLQHTLASQPAARIVDTEYAANVTFTLAVRAVDEQEIRELLAGLLQRDPGEL